MAQFEPKPNTGVLFNKKTQYSDQSGNALITCPHCQQTSEFWADAKNRESQNGNQYVSLKFKPKQARPTDKGSW